MVPTPLFLGLRCRLSQSEVPLTYTFCRDCTTESHKIYRYGVMILPSMCSYILVHRWLVPTVSSWTRDVAFPGRRCLPPARSVATIEHNPTTSIAKQSHWRLLSLNERNFYFSAPKKTFGEWRESPIKYCLSLTFVNKVGIVVCVLCVGLFVSIEILYILLQVWEEQWIVQFSNYPFSSWFSLILCASLNPGIWF